MPGHEVLQDWCQRVIDEVLQCNLQRTYERLVELPYHGRLADQLTTAFQAQQPLIVMPSFADCYVTLQEAIALWQDDHLVPQHTPSLRIPANCIRVSLDAIRLPPIAQRDHVQTQEERREQLLTNMWEDDSVICRINQQLTKLRHKEYVFPDLDPIATINNPVFIYVFSGRRRLGDFQFHVEESLARHRCQGRVLLLDLALSPLHDVYQPRLMNTILSWIHGGVVGGLLAAPPCETWSEARHLPAEGKAPRPLRSSANPFLEAGLEKNELEQVTVSNFLLFVALRVLFTALLEGVGGILEHPKQPRKPERASIWRLPWIQYMQQHTSMRRVLLWQAMYGAASPKPTHLAVVNVPRFEEDVKPFQRPVQWDQLQQLGGRKETGEWRTASAKEYPPRMNAALGEALVHAYINRHATRYIACNLEQVDDTFQQLYMGDSDFVDQAMQPDFHRINREQEADELNS